MNRYHSIAPVLSLLAALVTQPLIGQTFTSPVATAQDLLADNPSPPDGQSPVETDRSSFTPATTTAGLGRLIVESSWSFIDNRQVPDTNSLPELTTRYGLYDWLELRLGWNYQVGGEANTISGSAGDPQPPTQVTIERASELFYGLKAALTSQDAWRPQSVAILQAGTPTAGSDPATQLMATYVFGWQLPNRWSWTSAIRYSYDSSHGDHFNLWTPSTVITIPLSEQLTGHVEYFGGSTQGRAQGSVQHYFSPGLRYLITPDLEVGVRLGWGLNEQASSFFSNIGFGRRY